MYVCVYVVKMKLAESVIVAHYCMLVLDDVMYNTNCVHFFFLWVRFYFLSLLSIKLHRGLSIPTVSGIPCFFSSFEFVGC